MQLIRALERMEHGDGIVVVHDQVVKFSNSLVGVYPTAGIKPEVEVHAQLGEVVKVRSQNEVWFR